MSDDLIQSIIREAEEQRRQYSAARITPSIDTSLTSPTSAVYAEEPPTPMQSQEQATQLDASDTDDIVSGMLEAWGGAVDLGDRQVAVDLGPGDTNSIGSLYLQSAGEPEEQEESEALQEFDAAIAATDESEEQEEETLEQLVPTLSSDSELRESTSRFSGAEWFKIAEQQVITFAGLGGIGSWAAFLLSRIHPDRMFLYDPDTVEMVNLSGQLYGAGDITNLKAASICSFISSYSNYWHGVCVAEEYTANSPTTNIMISGFDNMAARKVYFDKWHAHVERKPESERQECLFIDARMSAEDIQILCMTGVDIQYMQEYKENWLFDDSEADATLCSYKQTSFCAAIIGGLISNLFVNFCTNLGNPIIARPLPFLTTYDASLMFLNVKS